MSERWTFDRKAFGYAIKIVRQSRGLTQRKAAKVSGLDNATLSRIEAGLPATLAHVVQITGWAGLTVEQFVRFTP